MGINEIYKQHVVNRPEKIFKFFSINENFIRTIKESYFWLSKPADFNDPFDCNPNLIDFKFHKKPIQQLFNNSIHKGNRRARREEVQFYLSKPEKIKKAFENAKGGITEGWGVTCFTRNFINNLMWSHYACKHTGVCLAFDPQQSLETFKLVKVNYTDHFEPLSYFDKRLESILNLFITKGIEWKYEEEWRVCKNKFGRLPFPKESLKEVMFGCKVDPKNKELVINLLQDNGYSDVTIKQAIMPKDSFTLNLIEEGVI